MTDETDGSISILSLCVWPKGCLRDKDEQTALAIGLMVPALKELGMTVPQWTRGALMLEEPYFSMVKSVSCRGCRFFDCTHNTTRRDGRPSEDIIDTITECLYAERREANAKLVEALLPKAYSDTWTALGLTVGEPFAMTSRTRFHLSVTVTDLMGIKTTIEVHRKKGAPGEIIVYAIDGCKVLPMPPTSAAIAAKLNEIVTKLVAAPVN